MDHSLFTCERKIARFRNDKKKTKFTAQGAKDKVWSKFTLFTYVVLIITRSDFQKGITVTFSTVNAKISFSSVLTEVIKIALFRSLTKK